MSAPAEEAKRPFWVKCKACDHCWPAAYLPMDAGLAGRLMKGVRCPMCAAGPKQIYVAKQVNGVLKEPA